MNNEEKESFEGNNICQEKEQWIQELNPHFLFNTLNSIKCTSIVAPEKVPFLIDDFATCFRYLLRYAGRDAFVPFREELGFVRSYLKLEQVRFSGIEVCFHIEECNFFVEACSIEKIVDTVLHMLRRYVRQMNIELETRKQQKKVVIKIRGTSNSLHWNSEEICKVREEFQIFLKNGYECSLEENGNIALKKSFLEGDGKERW